MSFEPNKPIEEQLRAFVRSRRADAPDAFELDGAARRRLQDEVGRTYRAEPLPGQERRSWRGSFWLPLGLTGATAAILVFLGVQLWPERKPVVLSANRKAEAPGKGVALRDVASFDQARIPQSQPEPAGPMIDSGPAPETPTSERSQFSGVPKAAVSSLGQAAPAERVLTPKLEAVSATAPPPAPAQQESIEAKPSEIQTFQQTGRYRLNPNSPPTPQVLQSFQWIRDGDGIRVVDADGSVYRGRYVVPDGSVGAGLPAGRARGQLVAAQPAARAREVRTAPEPGQTTRLRGQSFSEASLPGERFTVSGINRTMNVRVVFEGVILPGTELARETSASAAERGTAVQDDDAGTMKGQQIQGQAVIGDSTRLEIRAISSGN